MNMLDPIDHGLVVYSGKTRYDLHQQSHLRICMLTIVGNQFEDVPVQIEGVLQISNLIFKLVVLLTQKRLLHLSNKII